ncbi:[protein-PII] uridylyltransferase [Plantactinospora sp. KBS50]|nr:HD domain-containing protein [Plantactinospora sp. KBS50]ASW54003.1 [protein-PII] uridylyltransferase [Plantactinospora sp. KBS50]
MPPVTGESASPLADSADAHSPAGGAGSIGAAARAKRAAAFDAWLAGLLPPELPGVALLAVGGLGRRECAPHGDLDLVLLHAGVPDVADLAASLWYPIWDARHGLDHSVRTVPEALSVAHDDPKVALGLLDARHLAGDRTLSDRLIPAAADLWRRTAPRRLAGLRELTEARWAAHGELAFLLEGDLKESAGGLRDVAVLRAIGRAGAVDALRPAVRAAHLRLLDTRDALHVATGRRVDRLVAQERAAVAELLDLRQHPPGGTDPGPAGPGEPAAGGTASRLGVAAAESRLGVAAAESRLGVAAAESRLGVAAADGRGGVDNVGDVLLRRVAGDARTIRHALDDAWRAVDRLLLARSRGLAVPRADGRPGRGTYPATGPARRPVAPDVVEQDGELVLARTAIGPRPDPSLSLRVAAAAATHRLPIARATCEWLAAYAPPMPTPWPAAARSALFRLLGAGDGLVSTWETCDRYGLVDGWLPEWPRLRSLPQHNPVHLFTLDRHLVVTVAEAGRYAREVDRPDLLLLGALLHDIGKGLPGGEHSSTGAPVAAAVATRLGLPDTDVATVERLVRCHLLLPDVATRRDLADPVTIAGVAEAVGDVGTLALLHGLVRADARATGPAAWSDWKARLIAELVDRVRLALDTGELPAPPEPDPELVAGALPAVRVTGDEVMVAAADRRGLLAAVAGCLAAHRLEVLTADASVVAGRALVRCRVQPRYGSPPEPAALATDLRRAMDGDESVTRRLRIRAAPSSGAAPRVVWHRGAATDATVLELRAADSAGLLHRVTAALDAAGTVVRAARVSTLGADVVDAFYLEGDWSAAPDRSRVEAAVLAAV